MHPLERRRKAAGLTQAELGNLVGVTARSVAKWESRASTPSASVYPKIAEALGITALEVTELISPSSPQTAAIAG
jgi:transcriptional regulator with XRE-family HTH domain